MLLFQYLWSLSLLTFAAQAFVCDEGFILWSNNCYNTHFSAVEVPYKHAASICAGLSAHLVSIHSDKENDFINGINGATSVWLGLRLEKNGWKWDDGTPFNYSQWDMLQPNGCCGQDVLCSKMNWLFKNGKWHDISCRDESGVICKYNPHTRNVYGASVSSEKNTGKKLHVRVRKTSATNASTYKSSNSLAMKKVRTAAAVQTLISTTSAATTTTISTKTTTIINSRKKNTSSSNIAIGPEWNHTGVNFGNNQTTISILLLNTTMQLDGTITESTKLTETNAFINANQTDTINSLLLGMADQNNLTAANWSTNGKTLNAEKKVHFVEISAEKNIVGKKISVPINDYPCMLKLFSGGRRACVCNATYCDNLPRVQITRPYQACILSSSRHFGFLRKQFAPFVYRRRASKATNQVTIRINGRQTYQKIIGFGGAFNDAVGINLNSLTNQTRTALLRSYFSSETGSAYTLGNVPVGSNSFSTVAYSYDDEPDDFQLRKFKLTEEDLELKIPYIKEASRISNDKLKLFATPWSAPAWMMKTGDPLLGGPLKNHTKYYKVWAGYLLRFMEEYSKNNISFWGITVQNRPESGGTTGWQNMYYSPEMQRKFVNNYLGPLLNVSPVGKNTTIIGFNDVREILPKWAKQLFDNSTDKVKSYISGLGVQWYHDNASESTYNLISEVLNKYPGKFVLSTEASNRLSEKSLGNWTGAELYANDIIQNLLNGASGWTDFNLCLDLDGGPSLLDSATDASIIVNTTGDLFYKQPMYYAIAHFSKYITPGSVRIRTSVWNAANSVDAVTFVTPAMRKVAVVVNRANRQRLSMIVDTAMPGRSLKLMLEPNSMTTVIWKDITKRRLKY